MKLSIVIPAYNEVDSLPKILGKVLNALPDVEKEIIVVDDGSTDGTRQWLETAIGQRRRFGVARSGIVEFSDEPPACADGRRTVLPTIEAIFHERNRGKGAALRSALRAVSGDVVVIQDADLEYDPADWARFWPLFAQDAADVVFGSRFYGEPHRCLYYHHYLANQMMSLVFSVLYNQILSDLEVGYKMFSRKVIRHLTLRRDDFGFEVEFSANVARARLRIYEVGISYYGRTYDEGKKINWKDGVKAIFYILWHRFA